MAFPQGFIPVAAPPVEGGTTNVQAPNYPVFIRARLVGFKEDWQWLKGGVQHWDLMKWPGWFLYGGPCTNAHAGAREQALKDWAFTQKANGETGFWAVTERVPIAWPGIIATHHWPRSDFRWEWQYDQRPPTRYRLGQVSPVAWNWKPVSDVAGLLEKPPVVTVHPSQFDTAGLAKLAEIGLVILTS